MKKTVSLIMAELYNGNKNEKNLKCNRIRILGWMVSRDKTKESLNLS